MDVSYFVAQAARNKSITNDNDHDSTNNKNNQQSSLNINKQNRQSFSK